MSGPFRIEKRAAIRAQADGDISAKQNTFKDYMARLIKLIPGEVIGVFVTGLGLLPEADPENTNIWLDPVHIWAFVCLLLVIFVRIWGTRDSSGSAKSIQWGVVFISSISYYLWVNAMGQRFFYPDTWSPQIISLTIIIWTFIIGYVYKGE
jgi:hypothetical protein